MGILADSVSLSHCPGVNAASSDNLLDGYCTKYHNLGDYSGGIDLEGIGP